MDSFDRLGKVEFAQSLSFIEERGSDIERAKIQWILYGVNPEPSVIEPFVSLQNRDGGFPCGMVKGNLSTVHKTLDALYWMGDLRLLESSTADQALSYLLAAQRNDGGWDEDPAIAQYALPPWISPGDLRTRLYLSSYATYWLAVRDYHAHPAFQPALQFLLGHRDEKGKFYGFLHNTWIATAVFALAGYPYAQVVEQGLQYLMDRPLSEWVDSQIAWALDCLGKAGVPKDHPFISRSLDELARRRDAGGGWASEDGEAFAVSATIEVLKVLKHFNLLAYGES